MFANSEAALQIPPDSQPYVTNYFWFYSEEPILNLGAVTIF